MSSDAEALPDSPFPKKPAAPWKRVCVLNPITRKLMILTPPQQKRATPQPGTPGDLTQPDMLSLQTMSFMSGENHGALGPINPFFFDDSAWMAGDFLGQANLNVNPAMTPSLFPNMGSEGSSTRTDDDDEDGEDEGERELDADLFLAFDSDDSEDEQGDGENAQGGEASDGKQAKAGKGSGQGGDSSSTVFGTLAHLGGMNVGAFRRNQTDQQLIARGEATPDSLAFSNPLFHGTLRGIRDGALPAAATSLTPERRRKPQPTKSPLEMASMKRKASGVLGGAHKKYKSTSGGSKMQM